MDWNATEELPEQLVRGLFATRLLNRFILAETHRAVAKPDRQTDGEAKTRLRRMSQIAQLPNRASG